MAALRHFPTKVARNQSTLVPRFMLVRACPYRQNKKPESFLSGFLIEASLAYEQPRLSPQLLHL